MKIKLLKNRKIGHLEKKEGTVLEVTTEFGSELIEAGDAKELKDTLVKKNIPAPKKEKKVETT